MCVYVEGFDAVSLDPTQFKELFRRNFGVLLTAKELGILVRSPFHVPEISPTGQSQAESLVDLH